MRLQNGATVNAMKQWIKESKPQSAETMAVGIANDLLGRDAPRGAVQMLTARLEAWEEAIVGRTLRELTNGVQNRVS